MYFKNWHNTKPNIALRNKIGITQKDLENIISFINKVSRKSKFASTAFRG